jgi:hypothetical protein
MNSAHRRHWKLAVIRALSAAGYHVATVRRTIGDRSFTDLLDQAFQSAPTSPVEGARIVKTQLEERYGELLERPVTPWSRT